MGGYGSSRWGTTLTRMSTEGLLRLDVRSLAREGGLRPGTSATVIWGEGATVTTEVGTDTPDVMAVRYGVRIGNGPLRTICEQILLLRTRCTLGGTRDWFGCPGCGVRCSTPCSVGSGAGAATSSRMRAHGHEDDGNWCDGNLPGRRVRAWSASSFEQQS